jgi:signal transduction histidine kinase
MSSMPNVIEFPRGRSTVVRDRQNDAARGAAEERQRIARDLHDVVSHSFATISMQAGIALHVLEERPEHATDALHAIRSASNQALGELRAILGMLRGTDNLESPRPGLEHIDAIVKTTSAAGLTTNVQVRGTRRQLPILVDHTAFHVIRESLTNVLRHAAATFATVTVTYGREQLIVEIDDDGPSKPTSPQSAPDESGYGILGMRERVETLGGELDAAPRLEGGFRVCARLPVLGRP